MKARRHLFALPFLIFWLGAWTIGGFSALTRLINGSIEESVGRYFTIFWLGGWAIGWLLVFFTVTWMLFGKEFIIIKSQAIIRYLNLPLLSKRRYYNPLNVSNVRAITQFAGGRRGHLDIPIIGKSEAVAFDYGSKTVRLGVGLDEAEAESVASAIRDKLGLKGVSQ
ncbi:hypothetical protein H2509_16990 [Stappia sp. F7233]|uniref:Uncharacterized protein n=1 Tax=Stappia albiluteola TaxID=2758565 RepID=A0A839AIS5_9HYPH|nr:hypothetical protein [Stappia albiluteola]MBA5778824.1 hypothetical protein [Stappia albiluteola]